MTPDRPTLVYLVGEPGVGKSTLMAAWTAGYPRVPLEPIAGEAPARDFLYAPGQAALRHHAVAVELGRQRGAFSGTDALGQTVINEAEAYLRSGRALREAPVLLGEGARLGNRRFLTAAVESGWRVVLVWMHGDTLAALRRKARAESLGKPEQNAAWVKGRRTAAANLARDAATWGVEVRSLSAERMDADADYAEYARTLARYLTPR